MSYEQQVSFSFEKNIYAGHIEKEYENSYLVVVSNPTKDMKEKYTDRMIISKKDCKLI